MQCSDIRGGETEAMDAALGMALKFFQRPEVVCFTAAFLFLYLYRVVHRRGKPYSVPTNWPVLGMLPAALRVLSDVHNKTNNLLTATGGTFLFKGPWFCNMDLLFTCNPQDINHILSKNFGNYPKGMEFKEKFEILGDGIFCTDFDLWQVHRTTILSFMSGPKFHQALERSVWFKIETGLYPVLEDFCAKSAAFDMQDIFQRFAFDNIFLLLINSDPGSLSPGLPPVPCEKAFGKALKPLFQRHVLPKWVWKVMKLLRIGEERKLAEAWKDFDDFIYSYLSTSESDEKANPLEHTIWKSFTQAYNDNKSAISGDLRTFLRDTLLSLLFAGSDTSSTTLTWLFFLVSQHPETEKKILAEIEKVLDGKWRNFTVEESHKLVYLHAAISESVRLFPPLALQYKSPLQEDVLPSGHRLRPNSKVVLAFYSVGRMKSLWGEDCMEFKPERWISSQGSLITMPSYKFPGFNVGPRTCLGKEMAYAEVKMVAAAILRRYKVQAVESHRVVPRDSIMLHAQHGLKVLLTKRT